MQVQKSSKFVDFTKVGADRGLSEIRPRFSTVYAQEARQKAEARE
jgi:hypothetical protein